MKIPKFWSRATAETTTPRRAARCDSLAGARPIRARPWPIRRPWPPARRILDASLRGKRLDRYEYGCMPLREKILNQVESRTPLAGRAHAERLWLDRAQHRAGDVGRHRLSQQRRRRRQVALQGPLRPQTEIAPRREAGPGPPAIDKFIAADPALGHAALSHLCRPEGDRHARRVRPAEHGQQWTCSSSWAATRCTSSSARPRSVFRARLTPKPWSMRLQTKSVAASDHRCQAPGLVRALERGLRHTAGPLRHVPLPGSRLAILSFIPRPSGSWSCTILPRTRAMTFRWREPPVSPKELHFMTDHTNTHLTR